MKRKNASGMTETYDSSYYVSRNDRTSRTAEAVLSELTEVFRDKSVLDIGCGVGTWAAVAARCGAKSVTAVDGSWVDRKMLQVSAEDFLAHDLSQGPPSFDKHFGLTIWLENAEHLPHGKGEEIVDWVCRHSDCALFSAAIPGQGGVGHVNEQWQSYWANRFMANGFRPFDLVRPKIWTNADSPYWYKQNIVLYVDGKKSYSFLGQQEAVRDTASLDVVHPEKWNKLINRRVGVREAMEQLLRSVRKKLGG